MPGHGVGVLAEPTHTTAPDIRFCEQIGLRRRPDRQDGNQRRYSDADVGRPTFIRRRRAFGCPIEQVGTLASLVQDRSRSGIEAPDIAAWTARA
ncbi:MAG: MerR family transcriptional regulator [Geminicoccaceae bacterium]